MVKFPLKKSINFLLIFFAGSSLMANARELTEFNWLATESAPADYPMQIMRGGSFRYHGAENDGLYIPSGGTLYQGWGNAISTHAVGPALKPLPDKLDITFYSYLEDVFYQGSFDLPYAKILSLFREGVAVDANSPVYNRVMVGIAPGGTVAVWVSGKKTVEVFFGKAHKADLSWGKVMNYPENERAEFVKRRQEEAVEPEVLAAIRKNGIHFNQWANFRTQYQWVPTFIAGKTPKHTNVVYFNGENDRLLLPLEESVAADTRPVPMRLSFNSLMKGETEADVFIIHFDEAETFAAFAKLGSKQESLHFEFEPKLPKSATKVRLCNGKESIQLTKWTIEEW